MRKYDERARMTAKTGARNWGRFRQVGGAGESIRSRRSVGM